MELEKVEELLRKVGFSFFSPRLECKYTKGDPLVVADRAAYLNRYHVVTCKFILACLTWPDAGTGWELGYADRAGTPRLGFTSNPNVGFNLMVAGTVNGLIPFSHLGATLESMHLDMMTRGKGVISTVEKHCHLDSWVKMVEE
jgi:nucleoside 2-deoxyribosyltransferase